MSNATDDQTGRYVRQPNGRVRPLSPHLQVWRFHATMAASILSRIAAGALYFGLLAIAAWVLCAALGPEAYAVFSAVSASWFGLLVWFGLSLALIYHLLAGIRHLVWDTGRGLTPKAADAWAHATLWGAVVAALAFWVALFAAGKVAL